MNISGVEYSRDDASKDNGLQSSDRAAGDC